MGVFSAAAYVSLKPLHAGNMEIGDGQTSLDFQNQDGITNCRSDISIEEARIVE
jgi:hypothetical protein